MILEEGIGKKWEESKIDKGEKREMKVGMRSEGERSGRRKGKGIRKRREERSGKKKGRGRGRRRRKITK